MWVESESERKNTTCQKSFSSHHNQMTLLQKLNQENYSHAYLDLYLLLLQSTNYSSQTCIWDCLLRYQPEIITHHCHQCLDSKGGFILLVFRADAPLLQNHPAETKHQRLNYHVSSAILNKYLSLTHFCCQNPPNRKTLNIANRH